MANANARGPMARSVEAAPIPRMPNLCDPRRGVRQTIDAAIPTLERLGVTADRIVLKSAGGGWIEGTVVLQEPSAGLELTSQTSGRVVGGRHGRAGKPALRAARGQRR